MARPPIRQANRPARGAPHTLRGPAWEGGGSREPGPREVPKSPVPSPPCPVPPSGRQIDLREARRARYAGMFEGGGSREPACLLVHYPPPPEAAGWQGYPFINNVHYFADPLVSR